MFERDWGDFSGWMIGAGVASLLVSRLCLWLASGLGDTRQKILVAHVITLFATVTAMSYGLAFGSEPNVLRGVILAMPPQLIWLVMDLTAQRRRARARAAQAQPEVIDPATGGPQITADLAQGASDNQP